MSGPEPLPIGTIRLTACWGHGSAARAGLGVSHNPKLTTKMLAESLVRGMALPLCCSRRGLTFCRRPWVDCAIDGDGDSLAPRPAKAELERAGRERPCQST